MSDVTIATIQKNRNEEIRVTLGEYQGHDLLNLRVWFQTKDGGMLPGKSGLALRVDLLPDFADAIALALQHVQKRRGGE